jgi:hypothetical protein
MAQYEKAVAADSSLSTSSVAHTEVLRHLRDPPVPSIAVESCTPIRRAEQIIESYKMSKISRSQASGARCPVAHLVNDPEDLEEDFTTPGIEGNLGCPFAKMAMANGLTPSAHTDPIAAEFHPDQISVQSPQGQNDRLPGQCPIRFLDQHSPEEVAKYFENHKHEIPRSHEICVRRYSTNESSTRQLDAKYGNLVNMIQGLGVKHKAYLPERERAEEQEKSSGQVVEKWAEDVSEEPAPAVEDVTLDEEEPRVSHFEKPLREVRVGESPTRPWGISVPVDKEPTPSALQEGDGDDKPQVQPESSQAVRDAAQHHKPQIDGRPKLQRGSRHDLGGAELPSHIVFNGPVFFGYSAEDVAMLLQKTNLGAMKPAG